MNIALNRIVLKTQYHRIVGWQVNCNYGLRINGRYFGKLRRNNWGLNIYIKTLFHRQIKRYRRKETKKKRKTEKYLQYSQNKFTKSKIWEEAHKYFEFSLKVVCFCAFWVENSRYHAHSVNSLSSFVQQRSETSLLDPHFGVFWRPPNAPLCAYRVLKSHIQGFNHSVF